MDIEIKNPTKNQLKKIYLNENGDRMVIYKILSIYIDNNIVNNVSNLTAYLTNIIKTSIPENSYSDFGFGKTLTSCFTHNFHIYLFRSENYNDADYATLTINNK